MKNKVGPLNLLVTLNFFFEILCEHFPGRSPGWCRGINPAGFGKSSVSRVDRFWTLACAATPLQSWHRFAVAIPNTLGLSARTFAHFFLSVHHLEVRICWSAIDRFHKKFALSLHIFTNFSTIKAFFWTNPTLVCATLGNHFLVYSQHYLYICICTHIYIHIYSYQYLYQQSVRHA